MAEVAQRPPEAAGREAILVVVDDDYGVAVDTRVTQAASKEGRSGSGCLPPPA